MTRPNHSAIRGNALFLILIAVALFAALAYAVTVSDRDKGSISKEKMILSTARMTQFMAIVHAKIELMTAGGLPLNQLKVNNDLTVSTGGALLTPAMGTPADPAPYLFHPQGGGVTPIVFTDITKPCTACGSSDTAVGNFVFLWANFVGVGTSSIATGADLSLGVPGLTNDACIEINKRFNPAMGTTIPVYDFMTARFTAAPDQPSLGLSSGTGLNGAQDFCFRESYTGARNFYVHILRVY